jgi:hypothetical protein
MAFDLESLYKSLIRSVMDVVDDCHQLGIAPGLQYYAWDSRAEVSTPPSVDLIGLAGWTFRENHGLWIVHAGITISTFNDENLFREIKIIDALHNRWGDQLDIPMLDKDTGEEYTHLKVVEFEIMPLTNAEKRNFRPIGMQLVRTQGD